MPGSPAIESMSMLIFTISGPREAPSKHIEDLPTGEPSLNLPNKPII